MLNKVEVRSAVTSLVALIGVTIGLATCHHNPRKLPHHDRIHTHGLLHKIIMDNRSSRSMVIVAIFSKRTEKYWGVGQL